MSDDKVDEEGKELNENFQPSPEKNSESDKVVMMAAESKEIQPEKLQTSSDDNLFSMIYSISKKIATVGIIYLIGYMGWSVAWLITPVILSVTREQWKKSSDAKRNIAKISALANEKDVILAKIDELPAWVYFPDVERCEWLNRILKQVWPNANHFARGLIKDTIEPNVRKALAGYKLQGFKFERMILGTIPPRIGGVKIYDKNIGRNEIIMDLDLFYASDCDISFTLSGLKGGIKDFSIHGMIRVIMKPLITKMPLVGGLQIFFLNNPNIDFNLVGVVDLLDMPGLSDMLRKIIVEQVAAIMVLPNKLPIQLSDDVPAMAIKMPEPEGVLRIHVIEAKDLMKKDIGMLGKGKSDPYAIITVGAQQFRTQTIDNTVNPKWDFWCEAAILAESGQNLQIHLHDEDGTSDDDLLGRATVEISNVFKNGEIDTWLTLEDAKHGMIHLRLSWLKLSPDRSELKAALEETQMLRVTSMSSALVTVFIDSAKHLPQARSQSQPDPYLVVSVGKQTQQTSVQMRTDAPVWEQGFSFLVNNPENDTVFLRIVDQKTEKELGRFTYTLSALLDKNNLEITSEPFQLQRSGPESKILLSMSLRIFKKSTGDEDASSVSSSDKLSSTGWGDGSMSRSGSIRNAMDSTSSNQLSKQDSRLSTSSGIYDPITVQEEPYVMTTTMTSSATPPHTPEYDGMELHHRVTSSGFASRGRIQLTLRYSIKRQRLIVLVHQIMNIPLKDPSNIPDPYVKLYLLPGRTKDSKRKTNVIKDNCNPVYDQTFEYVISAGEVQSSELEVTVATQKGFLSSGSPIIGIVKIKLNDPEISSQGFTGWHDLLPENKYE